MKTFSNYVLMAGFILGLSACSSDDSVTTDSQINSPEEEEAFTLIAKYKGSVYEVPCVVKNDSLIYLDEEFNSLYRDEISMIPDLAMLTYKQDDGTDVVEYYNSAEELETKNSITYFNDQTIDGNEPVTKVEPSAGRAILYDDTNFKDRVTILDINYDLYLKIPHLKPFNNFNDKTSSIRVYNFIEPNKYYRSAYAVWGTPLEKGSSLRTCLIGFENDNFKGKALYCVAEYSPSENINIPSTASHQDWKLKNLGWNDKITSVVFRIIRASDIGSNVVPHD